MPILLYSKSADPFYDSYNAGSRKKLRPHPSSYLQNPYYFMYASLANPETDDELHLLKDGKTRCTTGSVVSSLYCLKDPEATGGELTVCLSTFESFGAASFFCWS